MPTYYILDNNLTSARLGFVAERGAFLLLWRRLEYDLLACSCALLPTFFFSYFFPASQYVYLCVPSSVQQPSATVLSASTHFIVRVLSACVICTLTHLGILLFYSYTSK